MRENFLQQFEGGKGSPAWWAGRQKEALAQFAQLGYPTTEQEDWRYTSVDFLNKISFERAPDPLQGGRIENDLVERSAFHGKDDIRLVFVNGRYSPELSVLQALPKGVVLGRISDLLSTKPELLQKFLTRSVAFTDKPFMALNTALTQDGAVLYLPKNVVVKQPIYFCHYSWAEDKPTASHPRNLIIAEEASQATIVEIYMGGGEQTYLTNTVTEVFAGPGSVIDHYKLQQESGRAYHLSSLDVHQDSSSSFSSLAVSLGAGLCRHEARTVLDAEGAACTLNGLFMVTGKQHVDNQTTIDHAKPHGTSRELYKGILDGHSEGVFNGKVIVRQDAQKTSSRQTNKNLLLSKDALMNTKPLLEIFANDVKCNHGATTGRLDEGQVFYLRSRGLGEHESRSLLTYAFAAELVKEIRVPALQKALEKWFFRRLLVNSLPEGL